MFYLFVFMNLLDEEHVANYKLFPQIMILIQFKCLGAVKLCCCTKFATSFKLSVSLFKVNFNYSYIHIIIC